MNQLRVLYLSKLLFAFSTANSKQKPHWSFLFDISREKKKKQNTTHKVNT